MSALLVGADVIESHALLRSPRLRLEVYGLLMAAPRTRVVLCSRQRGVSDDISNDTSQLTKKPTNRSHCPQRDDITANESSKSMTPIPP